MEEKRAVCLNCMDGRVQIPVINYLKSAYDLDHVDMITDPGMDGIISDQNVSLDEYIRKIGISIRVNNAVVVALAAHFDCRGNPVNEQEHKKQVLAGLLRLKSELSDSKIVGLWVNSDWEVVELS